MYVVSLYAKLIGELMFIAINTQPLIAQPVNALARFMTTANAELYVLAKGVLRYLKGVKARKIVWCASRVKFPFVPCELYAEGGPQPTGKLSALRVQKETYRRSHPG